MTPIKNDNDYEDDDFCQKDEEHKELRRGHTYYDFGEHGNYYGKCMYCILEWNGVETRDNKAWEEEWSSWGEIAGRVLDLVEAGRKDTKDGTVFNVSLKKKADNTGHYQFVKAYMTGRGLTETSKHAIKPLTPHIKAFMEEWITPRNVKLTPAYIKMFRTQLTLSLSRRSRRTNRQ